MMLWSLWGSKHDESAIKREEEADKMPETTTTEAHQVVPATATEDPMVEIKTTTTSRPRGHSIAQHSQQPQRRPFSGSRSQSRTRRRTVTDTGQTDETMDTLDEHRREHTTTTEVPTPNQLVESSHLAPTSSPFPLSMSKNLSHLRAETASLGGVSTMTDREPGLRNASTVAVFSAPGVVGFKSLSDDATATESILSRETGAEEEDNTPRPSRPGTPASKGSVHRLQANQTGGEGGVGEDEGSGIGGAAVRKRNVSNVAIAGVEGISQSLQEAGLSD